MKSKIKSVTLGDESKDGGGFCVLQEKISEELLKKETKLCPKCQEKREFIAYLTIVDGKFVEIYICSGCQNKFVLKKYKG